MVILMVQDCCCTAELRTGAIIAGIFCIIYFGALGGYKTYNCISQGAGDTTKEKVVTYGQIVGCVAIIISSVILLIGACVDWPSLGWPFAVTVPVYCLWCVYLLHALIKYCVEKGFTVNAGFSCVFEICLVIYCWMVVVSYMIEEDW